MPSVRLVHPRISSALGHLSPSLREKVLASGEAKSAFRTLVKRISGGVVTEKQLHLIAQTAAKRAVPISGTVDPHRARMLVRLVRRRPVQKDAYPSFLEELNTKVISGVAGKRPIVFSKRPSFMDITRYTCCLGILVRQGGIRK